MVWVRLPKSGQPMWLNVRVSAGLVEIPEPTEAAETEPAPADEPTPEFGDRRAQKTTAKKATK